MGLASRPAATGPTISCPAAVLVLMTRLTARNFRDEIEARWRQSGEGSAHGPTTICQTQTLAEPECIAILANMSWTCELASRALLLLSFLAASGLTTPSRRVFGGHLADVMIALSDYGTV